MKKKYYILRLSNDRHGLISVGRMMQKALLESIDFYMNAFDDLDVRIILDKRKIKGTEK
jgi:hypothetical protein